MCDLPSLPVDYLVSQNVHHHTRREVQLVHTQLGKTVLAICHRLKDIEQSQNPRCAIARRKLMEGTPADEKPSKGYLGHGRCHRHSKSTSVEGS